jgi:hypothetical protein
MKTTRFVDFKVFTDGHKDSVTFRVVGEDGKRFNKSQVAEATRAYVHQLESKFPLRRFKAIPISLSKVNIVHEVGNA